jgi:hypothetical protein
MELNGCDIGQSFVLTANPQTKIPNYNFAF